jgi:2,3-bisphosphoglycerate-independent phosphoglycerate mutase
MKYIVIVPDGMADEPLPELNGKTPLETARTPNMDYLAQNGFVGTVRTIPDGMAPGSDVGNMSLLGYDPKVFHCGRGPLEAANMGIMLGDDQVAIRCNFVTLNEEEMADYSAGHITTKEAGILIDDLNKALSDDDQFKFYPGKSYRHLLIVRTEDPQSLLNVETTPPHDIMGQKIKSHLPKGPQAAFLIDMMTHAKAVLENHSINQVRLDLKENPANGIWLWGQGGKPQLPLFKERYGVEGAIISAVDLVNGIGRIAGLHVINVPGITGYYDTNYAGKGQYGLKALKACDFVFIHIEAPDEAGHNGDAKAKIEAIERIDEFILGAILNHFGRHDDFRVMVLSDHPTPVSKRTHTADPVGFAMYGKGIAHNGRSAFTEKAAAQANTVFENGEQLMSDFIRKNL